MPLKKRKTRIPRQFLPITITTSYYRSLSKLVSRARRQIIEMPIREWVNRARLERMDVGEGKLVREAFQKLKGTFVQDFELESLARLFANQTSSAQRFQLQTQVRSVLGVDLIGSEHGISRLIEGFIDENVSLIRGMTDEYFGKVERAITRGIQQGTRNKLIEDEIIKETNVSRRRAALIARDQIGKFHGSLNAARQQNIGLKRFVWRTVGDKRVRSEHADRSGETYFYSKPPNGELPGQPINCRCYAEPVFDDLLGDE